MKNEIIHNLYDTIYCYKVKTNRLCGDIISEHMLIRICSGEMLLEIDGKDVLFRENDLIFLKRNHLIKKIIQLPGDKKEFDGLYLIFRTPILKKIYSELATTTLPEKKDIENNTSVVRLEEHKFWNALFSSLDVYSESSQVLSEELMEAKLKEAALILLQLKPELAAVLFDFAKPWKIDLEEFMTKNYKCDLSIKEFAHFTGRSLTVFKEEFANVFNETPNRWLIKKRLAEALILMSRKKMIPSDVYLMVGFKNFSHFSKAFKKEYGYPPSMIAEKAQ